MTPPTDFAEFLAQAAGDPALVSFGDPDAEFAALRDGAGLTWRSDLCAYRFDGADRTSFLHRLLTANVETLTVGHVRSTLLLDNKGRVQLVAALGATDEALVMVGSRTAMESGVATLARYVLAADVKISLIEATVLELAGPATEPTLAALDFAGPVAAPTLLRGEAAALILATTPIEVWKQLIAAGVCPVGHGAVERMRIKDRRPAQGAEITGAEFPQELLLTEAVDFDKGCYLGQETVARIHYRGQVNRVLSAVYSDENVEVGDELFFADRGVGRVTSSHCRPEHGSVALALLARASSAAGTCLTSASGAVVTVTEDVE
jgi:folate-binding protein YgfZ